MKCPKCSYLGFETGDRCKNCGYDFSLLTRGPAVTRDVDVPIRAVDPETATTPDFSLPLFTSGEGDDLPLVTLPATPRPPLAVRRTPDAPRVRTAPKIVQHPELALTFRDEMEEEDVSVGRDGTEASAAAATGALAIDEIEAVGGRRIAAALIDHAILLAIDVSVIYFTLRMAGLDGGALDALPLAPLATFLLLYKLAYFTAFTAVGGQTIGKMTVGIRVIGDEGRLDGARAMRRTLAGLLSLLPLGLGFLPAFFGSDRRALHDRLTQTRVIGLPSA